MGKVIDLDVIRPEKIIVKLGGHDIDVSFIPAGITFDLDSIIRELMGLNQEKLAQDPQEMQRAFNLSIKLCSLFCEHLYPEMDEKWFRDNVTSQQINAFAIAIQDALKDSYRAVETYAKN